MLQMFVQRVTARFYVVQYFCGPSFVINCTWLNAVLVFPLETRMHVEILRNFYRLRQNRATA